MTTWYEKNRDKAIADAKAWRLSNLDRYRATQNAWKKRKRAEKRTEKAQNRLKSPILTFMPAPGYHPSFGDYPSWCKRFGIDPKKSWTEPTDEYFE